MVINSLDVLIEMCKHEDRNLFIWGAGFYGEMIGHILDNYNVAWGGYFDNYIDEDVFLDKPILSNTEIDLEALYILSMGKYREVYEQLASIGIMDRRIMCLSTKVFREIEEINGFNSEMEQQLLGVKDKYKGQTCFVIGNGPSLRLDDLMTIKCSGIKSFGCNGIWSAFDKTNWRPDFYFVSDIYALRKYTNDSNTLDYLKKECGFIFLRCGPRTYRLLDDNVLLFNQVYSHDDSNILFSEQCEKQVYIGFTVTYIMIQMAVHMGFSTIYLLGIDHSYSTELHNGTVEEKECEDHASFLNEGKDFYDIYRTTKAYQSARIYAEAHGITILNATKGGRLEVFPRVDFDGVFEG